MFSHFDNNWHKSHTKLNICEIVEISYNHLNFLTSFSDIIYITKIVNNNYKFIVLGSLGLYSNHLGLGLQIVSLQYIYIYYKKIFLFIIIIIDLECLVILTTIGTKAIQN